MSATYTTCQGMRGLRTARGSKEGVKASVQSYDGSIISELWYNDKGELRVRVGTSDYSSNSSDWNYFSGTFEDFKALLKLNQDIKNGKVSITRHREKSNKQLALERAFKD